MDFLERFLISLNLNPSPNFLIPQEQKLKYFSINNLRYLRSLFANINNYQEFDLFGELSSLSTD